jgi:hypothetical protein
MRYLVFPKAPSVVFPQNSTRKHPLQWPARVEFRASADDVAILEAYAAATGQKTTAVLRGRLRGLWKEYARLEKTKPAGES